MKSRPLKVGEYRKVKTWEQLLATEGAKFNKFGDIWINKGYFGYSMDKYCNRIFKIIKVGDWFTIEEGGNEYIADFFTNDYYDSNGNEIEPPRERIKTVILEVSGENIESPNLIYHWVDDINPLDQLEDEARQIITKISKLREIEAKQVEIDTKIEEQNKRIEEYERD